MKKQFIKDCLLSDKKCCFLLDDDNLKVREHHFDVHNGLFSSRPYFQGLSLVHLVCTYVVCTYLWKNEGKGVIKLGKWADVVYGWPLTGLESK